MKIVVEPRGVNVITFGDLSIGDAFSLDDYSGLFLKSGPNEAVDLSAESLENFKDNEEVIRREIKIVTIDPYPVILD